MIGVLMASLMMGVTAGASAPRPAGELRATFIGNMAWHITDGRVAVLVDFPYESGTLGHMEWSKSTVPAGPAPLCVISHSHTDHFAPRLARDFCARVLGPRDVVQGSRVLALKLTGEVRWEGISIRPLATPHDGLEHYSFLMQWGGRRLFFTGDTGDTVALLAARNLDVAFVSPWLLKTVQSKKQRIDARQVVVYHHTSGEIVPEIQGRLLPKPGDVLVLPPGKGPVRVIVAETAVIPGKVDEDEFEKRFREARENVQTPAGLAYNDDVFSPHFFPSYSPRLSECMKQTGDTEMPSFDLVLDLGADGRVEGAMVRPETKLTTCFTALSKKDIFPPPPFPAFRVPVSMRSSRP